MLQVFPPSLQRLLVAAPLLALVLCAGCGGGDDDGPPADDGVERWLDVDAPPVAAGDWYRPPLGVDWHWQLSGTVSGAVEADLYDVDLFDVPDSTLERLRQDGRRLIAYFSAGSLEDWREDAAAFPADAVGRPLDGWAGERWLDVRRREVWEAMEARLDLAASRGFDGVEADNVSAWTEDTGFPLDADDQLAWIRNLANGARERGLAFALKNDGEQLPELLDYVDFAVVEEAFAYGETEAWDALVAAGKPVLMAEYAPSLGAALQRAGAWCGEASQRGFRLLVLPLELDGGWRVACP